MQGESIKRADERAGDRTARRDDKWTVEESRLLDRLAYLQDLLKVTQLSIEELSRQSDISQVAIAQLEG